MPSITYRGNEPSLSVAPGLSPFPSVRPHTCIPLGEWLLLHAAGFEGILLLSGNIAPELSRLSLFLHVLLMMVLQFLPCRILARCAACRDALVNDGSSILSKPRFDVLPQQNAQAVA